MAKGSRAPASRPAMMTFLGTYAEEIPGWGVAEPGGSYPFNEAAFATGRFSVSETQAPAAPAEEAR